MWTKKYNDSDIIQYLKDLFTDQPNITTNKALRLVRANFKQVRKVEVDNDNFDLWLKTKGIVTYRRNNKGEKNGSSVLNMRVVRKIRKGWVEWVKKNPESNGADYYEYCGFTNGTLAYSSFIYVLMNVTWYDPYYEYPKVLQPNNKRIKRFLDEN